MPLLMAIAEWQYLKTGDEVYYTLARRWAAGTAIMFAIGAASGTVLSFELGLFWPRFIKWAGGIIGMPFSLEGFAFFTDPADRTRAPSTPNENFKGTTPNLDCLKFTIVPAKKRQQGTNRNQTTVTGVPGK